MIIISCDQENLISRICSCEEDPPESITDKNQPIQYKPFSLKHADKFSLGDFNDPYLIRLQGSITNHIDTTQTNSGIKLNGSEQKISYQIEEDAIYLGINDLDFDQWESLQEDISIELDLVQKSQANLMTNLGKKIHTPHQHIYTWRDLHNIRHKLDGHYHLKDHIHLPEPGTEGLPRRGFTPIGGGGITKDTRDISAAFEGSLEGHEKWISNLNINLPSHYNVGLFGYIKGANAWVKNLNLNYNTIKGYRRIAPLVGFLKQGTVSNIVVQASFDGANSRITGLRDIGGIVGHNRRGKVIGRYLGLHLDQASIPYKSIPNHQHLDLIIGDSHIGGLVGHNGSKGKVRGYAAVEIIANYDYVQAGGLVGHNTRGTRIKGYARGFIHTGDTNLGNDVKLGGLVGYLTGNTKVMGTSQVRLYSKDKNLNIIGERELDMNGRVGEITPVNAREKHFNISSYSWVKSSQPSNDG